METEFSLELTIDGEWLILDVVAVVENGYYTQVKEWSICKVVQPVLARFYNETSTPYRDFFNASVLEAINKKLANLNAKNKQAADDFVASFDSLPENAS